MQIHSVSAVSIALACCVCGGSASSQCTDWTEGLATPGVQFGSVYALSVEDLGGGPELFVGGNYTYAGGEPTISGIASWNGRGWKKLAGSLSDTVAAIAAYDDGSGKKLYIGGTITFAGGAFVARHDGTAWSPLGVGTNGEVLSLTVFDDGSGAALYAAGDFTTAGGATVNNVAKWDGASWSALGAGLGGSSHWVRSLKVFDDGSGSKLYAGGMFVSSAGTVVRRVARWDGSAWSPLDDGFDNQVRVLEVFDDGAGPKLYAGGHFMSANGVSTPHVAKFNGTSWESLAGGMSPFQYVVAMAVHDDGAGDALYVGGPITLAGGVTVNGVAKWDGFAWSAVGDGITNGPAALESCDLGSGPTLFAGGSFQYAGGKFVSRLAKLVGATWRPLGVGMTNQVRAFSVFDDGGGPALYAGGHFYAAGSSEENGVARWTGSDWEDAGAFSSYQVHALGVFDLGSGPRLFAGGLLLSIESTPVSNIAERTGPGAWSAMGGGVDGDVVALEQFDDGSGNALYAGGAFTTAGGSVSAPGIARWSGTSWSSVGSGTNVGGSVRDLERYDDGGGTALYALGSFTTMGGVTANNVAKWNGSSWSALGSGLNGAATTAVVWDDGGGPALYVGGEFTHASGAPVGYLARWDGSSWSSLAGGADDQVRILTVFDDGSGPKLFAGGRFDSIGGNAIAGFARWDGTSWSAVHVDTSDGFQAAISFDDDGDGTPELFLGSSSPTIGSLSSGFVARLYRTTCCSGGVTSYCTAGTTTNGCNAVMSSSGTPSATASSGFTLTASNVEGQKTGLLFYGASGPKASVWAPGSASFLCVKSPVQRTPSASSGGTADACDGALSIDWLDYLATHPGALGNPFSAGAGVWAQAWFRDPPAPGTTNLSDGLTWTMCP